LFQQVAQAFLQVFAFQPELIHDVAVGVLVAGLFRQMLDDAAFVVPGAAFGDNGKQGAGFRSKGTGFLLTATKGWLFRWSWKKNSFIF